MEEDPVVETLNLAILFLPEEDVLEPAGGQHPVLPAVVLKPELLQQLLEVSVRLDEEIPPSEERQCRLHGLCPHDLVQEAVLLPPLAPGPVLPHRHVLLVVVVEEPQLAEGGDVPDPVLDPQQRGGGAVLARPLGPDKRSYSC